MVRYYCLNTEDGAITVRRARRDDIKDIVRIGKATFPHSAISRHKISDRMSRSHFFFVAELKGKVVGFVDIRLWKTSALISGIATDSKTRGKGIGTALIRRSIDFARKKGKFEIELKVIVQNIRAVSFYKKEGFTVFSMRSRKDDLVIYRMFRKVET
ncbi:MAG: GNAT family N-acetyltransferase [Candidatus Micrarchaeota archaeon]